MNYMGFDNMDSSSDDEWDSSQLFGQLSFIPSFRSLEAKNDSVFTPMVAID